MFTGLIEERGEALKFEQSANGSRLTVLAPLVSIDARIGDSIAVNGCCLTVSAVALDQLTFDLLSETMMRTNLKHLTPGAQVNLERALAADGRLGGHFVQGHIDGTSQVLSLVASGLDYRLEIALPAESARYVVSKGSIAIDGISLTVSEIRPESFVVWIIPHTWTMTNLQTRQPGELVNLEFDLLAKYVERLLTTR